MPAVADPKDERPARWPPLNAEDMLARLIAAGVDFVVIGGIAMVLHGSARLTRDLDIIFATDPVNLDTLGSVLIALGAQLREVEDDLPFVPDRRTLAHVQLLTLETSSGWLDVHGAVDGMPAYSAFRKRAERMDLGSFSVLVASLEDMAAMQQASGRPQDLADLEEIQAIERLQRQP